MNGRLAAVRWRIFLLTLPSALLQGVAVAVPVAPFTPAGMPWGRLHVHLRDAEAWMLAPSVGPLLYRSVRPASTGSVPTEPGTFHLGVHRLRRMPYTPTEPGLRMCGVSGSGRVG
ncbi:hypothetical protein IQ62_28245 [Streptomyces scabiei]|nr:hypothetical protein IQ62_28245 [Streptomyces scabiei]